MAEGGEGEGGPRVAFVAASCILDNLSGAALVARSALEMLAAEGFDCLSLTPTVLDGDLEVPFSDIVGTANAARVAPGQAVEVRREGVRHRIFRTGSTLGGKMTDDEYRRFAAVAEAQMRNFAPQVLVSYGSNAFTAALLKRLRPHAGTLLFWFLNAGISRPDLLEAADAVLCPSRAMAELCRTRFGRDGLVFPDPILPRNAASSATTLALNAPETRAQGLVTFINPAPPKGATLVFAMAREALDRRPDLTFLVVEGRVRRTFWEESGVLKRDLPNLWWLPRQADLRSVYDRTSALLFPSYGFEASGRCVAEAQLGGIPVLASRRGGIPEQLNGGGFLFDLPEAFDGRRLNLPGSDVIRPWLDTLGRLADDGAFYRQATERAQDAARPFRRQDRQPEVARLFRDLAAGRGGI